MPEKLTKMIKRLDPDTREEIEDAAERFTAEDFVSWITNKFDIEL